MRSIKNIESARKLCSQTVYPASYSAPDSDSVKCWPHSAYYFGLEGRALFGWLKYSRTAFPKRVNNMHSTYQIWSRHDRWQSHGRKMHEPCINKVSKYYDSLCCVKMNMWFTTPTWSATVTTRWQTSFKQPGINLATRWISFLDLPTGPPT